jgi:competence protein ComEC
MAPLTITAAAVRPGGAESWLGSQRALLTTRVEGKVGGDAGTISAAFVTGDQGAIPEPVNVAMRNSGLALLLSISGVHITIVVAGTMWLIRKALALSPWIALRWTVKGIAAAAATTTGIAYTLIAGSQVPTVLSWIATVIVLLGIALGRDAPSLAMISAGAFFIILVRAEALLDRVSRCRSRRSPGWFRSTSRASDAG